MSTGCGPGLRCGGRRRRRGGFASPRSRMNETERSDVAVGVRAPRAAAPDPSRVLHEETLDDVAVARSLRSASSRCPRSTGPALRTTSYLPSREIGTAPPPVARRASSRPARRASRVDASLATVPVRRSRPRPRPPCWRTSICVAVRPLSVVPLDHDDAVERLRLHLLAGVVDDSDHSEPLSPARPAPAATADRQQTRRPIAPPASSSERLTAAIPRVSRRWAPGR